MAAHPPVFDNDLQRQAHAWLLLVDEGDTEPIVVDDLRRWLDQMPQRLSETTLTDWTLLMGTLIWSTYDQPEPNDAVFLKTLLDHAVTVPMHEWLAEEPAADRARSPNGVDPRPAYDALRWLTYMLSRGAEDEGPANLFVQTLGLGWAPEHLLWHLDQAREIQSLYMDDDGEHERHTAQNLLIQAVLATMGTTTWRPTEHPVWELLWLRGVHTYYHDEVNYEPGPPPRKQEKRQAALATYQLFPQYTPLVLTSYNQWKDLRRHLPLSSLFPLVLTQSDPEKLLRALLSCRAQRSNVHNGGVEFNKVLTAHHPELVELLDLHTSFYAQPHQASNAAGDVVEAFCRMVNRTAVDSLALPDLDSV